MNSEIVLVEPLNSQVVLSAGEGADLKDLLYAVKYCQEQSPHQLADIHHYRMKKQQPLREAFRPKNIGSTLRRNFNIPTIVGGTGFLGFVSMGGVAAGYILSAITPAIINAADPAMIQAGGVAGFIVGCMGLRYTGKEIMDYDNEIIAKMQKSAALTRNSFPKIDHALNILHDGSPSEKVVVNAILPVLFQEAIMQVENAIQVEEQRNHAELFARATAVLGAEKNNMIPIVGGRSAIQDKLRNK